MKETKLDQAINALRIIRQSMQGIATKDYLDGLKVALETLIEIREEKNG